MVPRISPILAVWLYVSTDACMYGLLGVKRLLLSWPVGCARSSRPQIPEAQTHNEIHFHWMDAHHFHTGIECSVGPLNLLMYCKQLTTLPSRITQFCFTFLYPKHIRRGSMKPCSGKQTQRHTQSRCARWMRCYQHVIVAIGMD